MMELNLVALPATADAESPDRSALLRFLLASDRGDLVHAVCPANVTSATHELPELDEAYFVLAGCGEIWRSFGGNDAVTALRPGRWVGMPAGTRFQYRANGGSSLVFLVSVMPTFAEDKSHIVDGGRWPPGAGLVEPATPETDRDDRWLTVDLPVSADYLAPDGSEIRMLGQFRRGGMAHCLLHPGATSSPVRHRTIFEIWFVVDGHGELWRAPPNGEASIVTLWPGVGLDISAGTSFQFRNTGMDPLGIVMLTMPQWPGPEEAIPVESGEWAVSGAAR